MTFDVRGLGGGRVVSYDRFKYALSNLDGRQWRLFEILANAFLAAEFPSLRPLASPGGDEGLDAGLFQPDDDPGTAVQYSVRQDWSTKIKQTCTRISETFPGTNVLIYATNQLVGAAANDLKKTIRRTHNIYLDIRDQEWFLTQRNSNSMTMAEAEEFCEKIADPKLFGTDSIDHQAQALTDLETKAAFVYLKLQWADDEREKGLTKLCFDALVRSVLRDTSSDDRMSRTRVKQLVANLLPAHPREVLDIQVDGALRRLAKVFIRHWKKQDEFCLTHAERIRLAERLAELSLLDDALSTELGRTMAVTAEEMGLPQLEDVNSGIDFARRVIEKVLLNRGEVFATAVMADEQHSFVKFADIEAVVDHEIATALVPNGLEPRLLVATVHSILLNASDETRRYLRSLADTYTLFAFMRETPDVQSAIVKIFAEGDIWLDSSVILPLLAETLLDEPARSHSNLLRAAVESGLRLHVTDGVLEEVTTHISRSRNYYRLLGQNAAEGVPPFLLSMYAASGRNMDTFMGWLETFAGSARPEDDVADYLEDVHRVQLKDLGEDADSADQEFRAHVSEVWRESREARERKKQDAGLPTLDPATISKLVLHDVISYVGITQRRKQRGERRNAFGYRSWWLTFDRMAFRMPEYLVDRLTDKPPPSPAISADFMVHYLAIGPVRARISKRTEETLPLMMNMSVLDAVPEDLVELASTLRRELSGLPPYVINRKIRDTMDEARVLLGASALGGNAKLGEEIKARLIKQAVNR